MQTHKTPSIVFLAIFFTITCFFSSTCFCQTEPLDDETDKIVAKVNGKLIKESRLTPEMNKKFMNFSKFGVKTVKPELLNSLKKKALDTIINSEVFSQAVQNYEIPDIDQKAQKELNSLKEKYTTPEEFNRYLAAQRLNEESLLTSLKNKLHTNAYLESQGVLHFEPTEKEIKAFYEKGKETYKKKETVKVRHILVQVEEDSDQLKDETARQEAEGILKKIEAGQDFATLAEKHSDCLRSNKRGGELDFAERGFMPPEFDTIAFSIEKGKTSDIIRTKYGYHILQVLEKDPAGYYPLDNVRDFIKKYLEEQHVSKLRLELVEKLRQQANIEVFLN